MEKEIGKIQKNDTTDIIVRLDDFGGKPGITIREYVKSERYTGFTKAGTRIPVDKFIEFRELLNTITLNDLNANQAAAEPEKIEEVSDEEEAKE